VSWLFCCNDDILKFPRLRHEVVVTRLEKRVNCGLVDTRVRATELCSLKSGDVEVKTGTYFSSFAHSFVLH
jgi:hypothetical protein